jgi:glycerate kinase
MEILNLDFQSLNGKVPIVVARLAKKYNKKVIAIVGSIGDLSSEIHENGITSVFSIISKPITLKEILKKEITKKLLENLAEQITRLLV